MISDPETDSPFRDQSDSGSCLSPPPPPPPPPPHPHPPPPTPTPHTAFSLVYKLCLLIGTAVQESGKGPVTGMSVAPS